MTTAPRHVTSGTGATGLAILGTLRRRGETARRVNRTPSSTGPIRSTRPSRPSATRWTRGPCGKRYVSPGNTQTPDPGSTA
jgi:hypothetical protein